MVRIFESDGVRMGKIDFGGVVKTACLEYLPEIVEGEYAIVHVGFAITRVDEAAALETLRLLHELGSVDDDLDEIGDAACSTDPFAAAERPRRP